jgi:hypothetical protein
MHADDFVINDGSTRETIEGVAKCFPKLDTETTTELVVEAVYPVDSRTLVVASEDEEVFRVLDLISKQQTDDFERLLSSVHVVPKK